MWLLILIACGTGVSHAEPVRELSDAELLDQRTTAELATEQKAALVAYVECVKGAFRDDGLGVAQAGTGACGAERAKYVITLPEGFEEGLLEQVDRELSRESLQTD